MRDEDKLSALMAGERTVRLVDEHIFSVLPATAPPPLYDRRARVYDMVVATRLYNSLMWGNSPLDYVAFARQAVNSSPGGRMLDAACGSMLFTAQVYLQCDRPIVAFDQSLAMLRRARTRLIKLAGRFPERVLLLQADLSDVPFREQTFQTILCMNVLHQYAEAEALLPVLRRLLTGDGGIYLTSLVSNSRFMGDRYLALLHASGEFVRPRSSLELKNLLDRSLGRGTIYRTKGNMAYAASPA